EPTEIYTLPLHAALPICDSLRADPSPTVRQLMKEPMSIFDWGLFRLQSDLQEDHELDQTKEFRPLKVYVGYTAKTNVIEIALFAYPKRNFVNEVPAKDICKNVTNYVRRFLNTGMPKHMRMYTGIT